MSRSATESTTRTTFSSMQTRLLSNEAPRTMSRAARSTSAVWSTTAGGLPGPAVIARLPVLSASRTTAGPPVTRTTRTPGWLMSARAVSMVGAATAATRFGGPPAATMARLIRRIVSAEQRFALGWALKTTAFPAETMLIVLLMIVEVGFVTGVIAATTPNGANSVTIIPASPVTAWTSRSSGPGALDATRRFLTTLSSTRPMWVSWWAIRASCSAWSSMDRRTASMMTLRSARPCAPKARNACVAAATASSIVAWMPSPSSAAAAADSSASARRPAPGRSPPADATRRRTRSMISWISRPSSSLIACRPLLAVDLRPAGLPRIDDRHDHDVARPVLRHLRLAGGAAGGVEDDLADARPDRVGGHDVAAGLPVLRVELAHPQERPALTERFLLARDHGPGHPSEKHLPPPAGGTARRRRADAPGPAS